MRAGRGRQPGAAGMFCGIRRKQAFASAPGRRQRTGEGFARQASASFRHPAGWQPAGRRGALRRGGDDSNVPHGRDVCRRRGADPGGPQSEVTQYQISPRRSVRVTAPADTLAGDQVTANCAPHPARRPLAIAIVGAAAETAGIRCRGRKQPVDTKTPARAWPGPGFVTGMPDPAGRGLRTPAGCGRSRRWSARR